MNKPFFSIIVPTYNRCYTLSRPIDSVLNQSFQNFELIIVDNGSTDATHEWLSKNYKNDKIIYSFQTGSGTPASPRNKGISLAKGEWVCFLDSDDMWKKEKLEFTLEAIQCQSNLDVICHNENIYYEDINKIGKISRYGPSSKRMYREMLIFGNRLSTSATSVKIEFLKKNNLKFNETNELATVEDYDLWLRLAMHNANFFFLSESLGFYTVGQSNMISNSNLFCKNLENLLRIHTFFIQKFTNQKDKLWNLLRLRVSINNILCSKVSYLIKIISILKIGLKNPFNFTIILSGYLKKKLVS